MASNLDPQRLLARMGINRVVTKVSGIFRASTSFAYPERFSAPLGAKKCLSPDINLLLTSNPAAYLQPQYRDQIDLRRLTRIYQWTDPTLDENAVFELQRENFVKFVQDPNKWVESLPSAILDRVEVAGWGWFGPNPDDLKQEAIKRLPQVLEVIESMIETNCRFEAYQAEVQAIAQLGISFHEWLQLAPSDEVKPDGTDLMYIIPDKPIEV